MRCCGKLAATNGRPYIRNKAGMQFFDSLNPPLRRLLLRVGVGGNFHGFLLRGGFGAGLGGSDKPVTSPDGFCSKYAPTALAL